MARRRDLLSFGVAASVAVLAPHAAAAQAVRPLRPGAPLGVSIPSAGVVAPVEPVWLVPPDAPATAAATGADQLLAGGMGGQIGLPSGPEVVGWFALSAAPGQAGSTLLVGHLDTTTGPAVFARLNRVRPGDEIRLALADGSTATYLAEATWRLPASQEAPPELFVQQGPPRLYLLTCYGAFVRSAGGYQDRLIVVASPPLPEPAPLTAPAESAPLLAPDLNRDTLPAQADPASEAPE